MQIKSYSLAALSAALMTAGVATAFAAPFYDPTNMKSGDGKTDGYELYRTIGCPGRALFDPPCLEQAPAKPVPAPAPKPAARLEMPNAKPGECYAKVVSDPVYRTESVQQLVKEASYEVKVIPAASRP